MLLLKKVRAPKKSKACSVSPCHNVIMRCKKKKKKKQNKIKAKRIPRTKESYKDNKSTKRKFFQ